MRLPSRIYGKVNFVIFYIVFEILNITKTLHLIFFRNGYVNNMDKPTLNQISSLTRALKTENWIQIQFREHTIYGALSEVSLKQFKFIQHLFFSRKNMKLRQVLLDVGVKPNV